MIDSVQLSRILTTTLAAAIAAVCAGCASVAVSNDAIEERTAFALSLSKGAFNITNRVDDGLRSSYSVTTNSGKKYNCYVSGTMSVVGRVVSDAICNEIGGGVGGGVSVSGGAGKPNPTGNTSSAPCNDLLKAAGRCPK